MKNIAVPMVAVALTTVVSGCITSHSPDCSGYTLQLPNNKEKKSVAYSFLRTANITVDKDFNPTSSSVAFTGAWVAAQPEAAALAQFRSTFEPATKSITPTVDRSGGDCDIMLAIHQQNAYNPLIAFPSFLHGFTLGLLPCWGDDVYYLNVTASNNKTGFKKEYLIRRNISTTSWLPFIFVMPFGELPSTAMTHITMENWKELRCKLEDDGFFDPVKAAVKAEPNKATEVKPMTDESVKKFAELKKLKDQGVLTQEEYLKAVERIK